MTRRQHFERYLESGCRSAMPEYAVVHFFPLFASEALP